MNNNDIGGKEVFGIVTAIFIGLLFIIGVIWGMVALYNVYSVWSGKKAGEAQLAEASYNRQIAVKEAEAKSAAATELAKAEIIRAKGVAKANKIIGQSLNNNESYLTYLWVQSLESKQNKVIYVPTEANLPILEASRLKKGTKK
jgi:uncharacterized iron-regulated membrane protein